MALNQHYNDGVQFTVPTSAVDAPAEPTSGDAVLVGDMPAVALTDPGNTHDGESRITVKTNGVYHQPVEAADGAVAVGDLVYITATGGLTNAATGNSRYGYALGPVAGAATAEIPVKIGY